MYTYVIAVHYHTGKRVPARIKKRQAKADGFEMYDSRIDCEAAIYYGLNAMDPKSKMQMKENGWRVGFVKNREYRSHFVSNGLAANEEEAARVVMHCWDIRRRAIHFIGPECLETDWLKIYKQFHLNKNNPPGKAQAGIAN